MTYFPFALLCPNPLNICDVFLTYVGEHEHLNNFWSELLEAGDGPIVGDEWSGARSLQSASLNIFVTALRVTHASRLRDLLVIELLLHAHLTAAAHQLLHVHCLHRLHLVNSSSSFLLLMICH